MWIPIFYINTSMYYKFRFVDLNSFEKHGRIVQIPEQGFDANIQTKNKEKPLITNKRFFCYGLRQNRLTFCLLYSIISAYFCMLSSEENLWLISWQSNVDIYS